MSGLHTGASDCSFWATPNTRDASASARGTTTTGVMHAGESLTDQMRGHHGPGTSKDGRGGLVLNPGFVERLMGLPEGWTDLLDESTDTG